MSSQPGEWGGEGQRHTRDGMTGGHCPADVEGQDPDAGEGPAQLGTSGLRRGKKERQMGVDGDPGTS